MARKKTMIQEDLGNGMVRLTAPKGMRLRHKATRRLHSEAVVPQDKAQSFEVL